MCAEKTCVLNFDVDTDVAFADSAMRLGLGSDFETLFDVVEH